MLLTLGPRQDEAVPGSNIRRSVPRVGNELSACCGAPSDEEDDALAYPAEWKREVVAREGEAAGIRPQARTSMDAGTAAIEGIPPDYRPRAAANQGEWGECTIFAFTEVVQDHLEVRFNTSLDERDTRSALTRPCNAFDGVWPEAVGAKINELGAGLKLKAKSPRPELYQLQIAGAKVTDFDSLCADAEAKAGAGAFSVVVIRPDHTPPDNLHSVAAHTLIQEATGPLILAKNSWGGNVPRYKVSRANYDSPRLTLRLSAAGNHRETSNQPPLRPRRTTASCEGTMTGARSFTTSAPSSTKWAPSWRRCGCIWKRRAGLPAETPVEVWCRRG